MTSTDPAAAPSYLGLRRRIAVLYLLLAVMNGGAWAWAFAAFHARPLLLSTALLAYGLGLRHAVDADHIAAIDNVTRTLAGRNQRPVAVGLFFALGHSAVVLLVAAAVAAGAIALNGRFGAWRALGGLVSTGISAAFLFLVAAMNAVALVELCRALRAVRYGDADRALAAVLDRRGVLTRLFRPAFRLVSASWHMLPIGFLFGLGFDTATEVSLLGMAAAEATHGLGIGAILAFPALFAAGMSLVDASDGVLMLGAYRWAFVRPARKLLYNLVITLVSVLAALLIGGIEVLGIVSDQLALLGGFWGLIGRLNDHLGALGVCIIGALAIAWGASVLIHRIRNRGRLEPPPVSA